MKILLFLILQLIKINFIRTACPLFQTKRTCECSIRYSVGDQPPYYKKLFDLQSFDDCGLNLGCENQFDCRTKCMNSVRNLLGGREDYITELGKNKICELISPNEAETKGIKIWAAWKYDICSSGNEPIVSDVCCNRKCNCKLVGQRVKQNNEILETFQDLKPFLPVKQKAYDCQITDMEVCEKDCMNELSIYFNKIDLKNINKKILNRNIFDDNQVSTKMCLAINGKISKPGIDIYAEIDVESEKIFTSLGRVCCERKCECDYVMKDAKTGVEHPARFPITQLEKLNLGYQCDNELNECMSFCRRQALQIVNSIDPTFDKNQTTTDLDAFKRIEYSKFLCETLNVPMLSNDERGYNFYVRYASETKMFPFEEDLHIGRLCCIKVLGQYVGVNRCDQTSP